MADTKVQGLSAEFELDLKSLNGQVRSLGRRLKGLFRPIQSDLQKMAAAPTVWKKMGVLAGGHFAYAFVRKVGQVTKGIGRAVFGGVTRLLTAPFRMLMSPLSLITGGVGAVGGLYAMNKIIRAGAALQDEMVEIQKTTDMAEDALARLTQRQIEFANKTGVARTSLMELNATAGRLGILQEETNLRFAQTFVKLELATDITREYAEETARLFNAIGEDVNNIDRFGSAINLLGNNLATGERRIMAFAGRLSPLSRFLKMSTQELLGLGAVLATTPIQEELAGTAMTQVAYRMYESVFKGGKQLSAFAETAGMQAEAFVKLFKEDATEAVIKWLEGVKKMGDEGGDLTAMFGDMGAEGMRVVRVILDLAGLTDKLRWAIKASNDEFERNTSLSEEVARRLNTVSMQAKRIPQIIKNFFATLNDNKLNTKLFSEIADALGRIFDNHKVSIAEKYRNIIKKIYEFVIELPFLLQKIQVGIKALFTDPKYLKGVLGAVGALLATALIEGFKTFITFVAGVADLIVSPIVAALKRSFAAWLATVPGFKEQGTKMLTEGLSGRELSEVAKRSAGRAVYRGAEQYAVGTFTPPNIKKAYQAGYGQDEYLEYAKNLFAKSMTPELFKEWVIPNMTTDEIARFTEALEKYTQTPEVRDRMEQELQAKLAERQAGIFEKLATRWETATNALGAKLDGLATALSGEGTAVALAMEKIGLESYWNKVQMKGGAPSDMYKGTGYLPNMEAQDPYERLIDLHRRPGERGGMKGQRRESPIIDAMKKWALSVQIELTGEGEKYFKIQKQLVNESAMAAR